MRPCARSRSTSAPARCIALVGHNGAGKTTLIKLMLGLIRADAGRDPGAGRGSGGAGEFAARRQLGYLPENVAVQRRADRTRDAGVLRAAERTSRCRNALELLDRVGLVEAAAQAHRHLFEGHAPAAGPGPGAARRRRALLLLDEPTTGLDPALRQSFYENRAGAARRRRTVVLSSHALTELEERADKIVVMNQGKALVAGTLDSLRTIARAADEFPPAAAGTAWPARCRPSSKASPTAAWPPDRRHRARCAADREDGAAAAGPAMRGPGRRSRSCRRRSTSSTRISCGQAGGTQ